MSFLIHLSLSNIVMILPLFLLLISDPFSHLASPRALSANLRNLIPLAVEFAAYFLILTLISTVVAGSWAWIPQTWAATYVSQLFFACHLHSTQWNNKSIALHFLILHQIPAYGGTSSLRCLTIFVHSS